MADAIARTLAACLHEAVREALASGARVERAPYRTQEDRYQQAMGQLPPLVGVRIRFPFRDWMDAETVIETVLRDPDLEREVDPLPGWELAGVRGVDRKGKPTGWWVITFQPRGWKRRPEAWELALQKQGKEVRP